MLTTYTVIATRKFHLLGRYIGSRGMFESRKVAGMINSVYHIDLLAIEFASYPDALVYGKYTEKILSCNKFSKASIVKIVSSSGT